MVITLTDEQIDHIAEKAAALAVSKMTDHVYKEVGKGVLNRMAFIIGVMTVSLYLYGQSRGWWK